MVGAPRARTVAAFQREKIETTETTEPIESDENPEGRAEK
jgi:hypothetical protein